MSLFDFENIIQRSKVKLLDPQIATYAGIGITTVILAYYTLYESGSTKSSSSEPEEKKAEAEPEEKKAEAEPEEKEEEEEPEPEKESEPEPEKEASLNPFTGGKKTKNKKTKSNRKSKKVKKNRTR